MIRDRPAYDLSLVRLLVREGRFMILSRALRFIMNRYEGEDPASVALSVIEAIREDDFYKSVELVKRPGVFADIYNDIKCEEYSEERWYVKLLISDDEPVLELWSLNWDGYIH